MSQILQQSNDPECENRQPHLAIDLSAKALESALWLALLEGQRIGFLGVADIYELHQQAGDLRRKLDAEANG